MVIGNIRSRDATSEPSANFSALEAWALRRTHPVSIIFDLIGFVWFSYFIWTNDWQYAVATIIFSRLFAAGISWDTDVFSISQTTLGRLALLHLHPVNITIHSLGFAILIYGIWTHGAMAMLFGFSGIMLGHCFGWKKVHSSFALLEPKQLYTLLD